MRKVHVATRQFTCLLLAVDIFQFHQYHVVRPEAIFLYKERHQDAVDVEHKIISVDTVKDIIVALHDAGLEMVALHDRPEGSRLGTYRYIIEVTGEDGLPDGLLAGLEAMPEVRFLGSFRVIEK